MLLKTKDNSNYFFVKGLQCFLSPLDQQKRNNFQKAKVSQIKRWWGIKCPPLFWKLKIDIKNTQIEVVHFEIQGFYSEIKDLFK